MKVIILHPTEELLLVNYQKELIKALYSDNRVIFAVSPLWAVDKGVTSGTGNNKFSPNDTCTRGQIVTFLYRWTHL